MLLICGTVPQKDLPLIKGEVSLSGEYLHVDGVLIPCSQGTAALISAATRTTEYLETDKPQVLLVGDDGTGKGSRLLYDYLIKNLPALSPKVLVLHYMLPIMGLMKKVCESASKVAVRPFMMADAAAMYAAKASGLARHFDIFTPDFSELAFLADPQATHPAYVSRHLFESDVTKVPDLISAAYGNGSAAKMLIVKGATDYIALNGRIIDQVAKPNIPALEAIGGTGDTIGGMIGALVHSGFTNVQAARVTIRANRKAGEYAKATPATPIRQIIEVLPRVFEDHMKDWLHHANNGMAERRMIE